jgi:thiol:disulfide interchange protein DsbC
MYRYPVLALGTLLAACAPAAEPTGVAPDVQAAIRTALTTRIPDVPVKDVRATGMPGIYEVYSGDSIAYTNANGDYLLVGSLIETRTGANLTAQSMDARTGIDFSTLPLDKAITIVKGNGKRTLALFTDPDCPFCRQLEEQLVNVTDVTIHVFLYPLTNLHPDAAKKAEAIWCASDRAGAWREWMSAAQKLPAPKACSTPLEDIQKLGDTLAVSATPTLFTAKGRRISGLPPADVLEKVLSAD